MRIPPSPTGMSGVFPASVQFRFPNSQANPQGAKNLLCLSSEKPNPPVTSSLTADPKRDYYTITVNVGDVFDFIGVPQDGFKGSYVIHDSLKVCSYLNPENPSEYLDNKDVISKLANRLAEDFYNWRSVQFDIVYNGIVAVPTDALVDEFIVDYTMDDCKTRIISAPQGGEPEEFFHEDGCTVTKADDEVWGRWALTDASGLSGSDGKANVGMGKGSLCECSSGLPLKCEEGPTVIIRNAGSEVAGNRLIEIQCIDGIYSILVDKCDDGDTATA